MAAAEESYLCLNKKGIVNQNSAAVRRNLINIFKPHTSETGDRENSMADRYSHVLSIGDAPVHGYDGGRWCFLEAQADAVRDAVEMISGHAVSTAGLFADFV